MVRKSPTESATLFKQGTKRKGNDGNIWIVKENKTGTKRWVKTDDVKIKISKRKKLELKGSYSGTRNFKKMKKFDILKSIVNNNVCKRNELSLDIRNDKIFIYHMYDSITTDYSGRWYNVDLMNGKFKLDGKKCIFTYYAPEWEVPTKKGFKIKKNVKIQIYFTEKGWNKFINYLYP